jgi:hypothetical protein
MFIKLGNEKDWYISRERERDRERVLYYPENLRRLG